MQKSFASLLVTRVVSRSSTRCLAMLGGPVIVFSLAAQALAVPPADLRFNGHIRPILAENCLACHGADAGSREADLRLDTREGAIESGAIVPGDAEASDVIARIVSDDPDYRMPPPGSRKELDDLEKQTLIRWVNEGASWEPHWSFISPSRPELPVVDGAAAWARNPIDYFVFSKLKEQGLAPNEPADVYTLLRSAALDITGLPPTAGQREAFLRDQREDAFDHYVDMLLQTPHAGEHRARYWLDAARYGDTHGMHVDNYREIWPYRDWVIRAFSRNMPFDQFVIEQIAGDLLPDATVDQQIATGFSRCNITTSEGGAIPDELNVRYMVDRVETTATVFLGLTAGCAVCHDHKYDPLAQREFYQMGAFFNNTTQPAMDGNMKDTPPVIVLPAKEYEEEWQSLQERRATLRRELRDWKTAAASWWPVREHHATSPIADDQLALFLPLTQDTDDGLVLPEGAEWAKDHPNGAAVSDLRTKSSGKLMRRNFAPMSL